MDKPDIVPVLQRSFPQSVDIRHPGFSMRAEPALGIAKLHMLAPPTTARFRKIMGMAPPPTLRQTDGASLSIAWMAPAEWLVTGPFAVVSAWAKRTAILGADDLLAIDYTHARAAFSVTGQHARARLAAHCPLDLWDGSFPVGSAARSLLGDTGMFIVRLADHAGHACFRVIVDQTMADYAARLFARIWLSGDFQ